MPNETLVSLDLAGVRKLRSGKVREVFDLGETLLFVATDRLSAFDVILPDPIPDKGAVLNQISPGVPFGLGCMAASRMCKSPSSTLPTDPRWASHSWLLQAVNPRPSVAP